MQEYATLIKPSYLEDRKKLPPDVQRKVMKCEELLSKDFRHPGLQTKKLKRQQDLLEARVDLGHRLVYSVTGGVIQLLAVGPHEIIDKRISVTPVAPEALRSLRADADTLEIPSDHTGEVGAERPKSYKTQDTRSEDVAAELPIRLDEATLTAFGIESEWHLALSVCLTEDDLLQAEVPEPVLHQVIDHLFPRSIETVQGEPNLVVSRPEDLQRHCDGELIGFLLQLDPEQEAAARRSLEGPAMVKGGPGTGKSTVALYRVKALIDRARDAGQDPPRILFTTYTQALVEFSRQLLSALVPEHSNHLTVSTIDTVAMEILAGKDNRLPMAGATLQIEALQAARKAVGQVSEHLDARLSQAGLEGVRDAYLLEEFEWVIEGRAVESLDEYLALDRRGRGYGFDRMMRTLVWRMYESYRDRLAEEGTPTWKQLERRALEKLRNDPGLPKWDFVIIDEAQDLAPVALALAAELCVDPKGIFFAADGCQSIYHKGFRFSHVRDGLDLRGRSTVLKRNYRSTREILKAAQDIVSGTGAEDPDGVATDALHVGERPIYVVGKNPEAQIGLLAREIKQAMWRLKLPISTLAVLCPSNRIADWCARTLAGYGIRAEYMKSRDLRLDSPKAKVMTIHTAKGLEFPMVAVARVEDGLLPVPLPQGAEDLEEHLNAQRRLLFVACTRAMRKLWVSSTLGSESPFLSGCNGESWTKVTSR